MLGKWKVHVVSQKCFAKARSNWKSLYSCVSWFNKVLKKVPKLASLTMFLMLGDNDSHVFFNTWRLPWLLRLCNTKSLAHHSMTNHIPCQKKSHVQKKISHNQNPYVQKLFTTKNHAPKKVNAPPHKKIIIKKKKPMPHQKFHHNQNFSHVHTQLPNLFSITTHKNFYMTKIANK